MVLLRILWENVVEIKLMNVLEIDFVGFINFHCFSFNIMIKIFSQYSIFCLCCGNIIKNANILVCGPMTHI